MLQFNFNPFPEIVTERLLLRRLTEEDIPAFFAMRSNPEVIDGSRRKRIAKGCGKDLNEVNAFMKQFDQMKQMMAQMNKFKGMGAGMPGMPMMGGRR